MDRVREIAEAVLYEGYVLWPYRRSTLKNRHRWTFGGVFPERWSTSGHQDDRWTIQMQCLVDDGGGARADVEVRFLHAVARTPARRQGEAVEPVDELVFEGRRHLSWDEATEREVTASELELGALEHGMVLAVDVAAGHEEEPLGGDAVLVRRWEPLAGRVEIHAEPVGAAVHRLTVRVQNTTPWPGGPRESAQRRAFLSTHAIVRVQGGELVSLTDPPKELETEAEACENVGVWPVLVGEEGDRGTVLASPIILSDYPQVAPESPGNFFDGAEIDQMLVLNILGMTEEEKAEMRDSDPRAREILERTNAIGRDEFMQLHGTLRDMRPLEEGG